MRMHSQSLALLAPAFVVPAALAQPSNIVDANKLSWSENCGWMNWRDAGSPASSQGVLVSATFLSGFIWCENIGWINLGGGSPADGGSYANVTGADFGVNLDPSDGFLSGFAWGENVGWINFSAGGAADPLLTARIAVDPPRRFAGFVWSENIGWINLNVAADGKHVEVRTCAADFNGDGFIDPDDLSDYIACYFGTPPCDLADFNADGFVDPDDLSDYISVFFGGCP